MVAIGVGEAAVRLAVLAPFQPHHLRLGAVAQMQPVMLFAELRVDAAQIAAAVGGQKCARILPLFPVAEQGAPDTGDALVPGQLAEGLGLGDSDQLLVLRPVAEIFAMPVDEQVDGRAVDQLKAALGHRFPVIRRDALAANPAGDRHELEIQILDPHLVDLLAHLFDKIVPALLLHKGFDIHHVAVPSWRALPGPVASLRQLTQPIPTIKLDPTERSRMTQPAA